MREDVEPAAAVRRGRRGEVDARRAARDGRLVARARGAAAGVRSRDFHVLDTTHPQAIRELEAGLDLERTLFVSASKSGSTLETRSHADYFWKHGAARRAVGRDHRSRAPRSTRSRASAASRAVFPGEPTIGGRYSALSPFGLVPAALMGVDLVAPARPRLRDGRGLPSGRGQPGARARALARRGLAGGPRQDLHARAAAGSGSGPSS